MFFIHSLVVASFVVVTSFDDPASSQREYLALYKRQASRSYIRVFTQLDRATHLANRVRALARFLQIIRDFSAAQLTHTTNLFYIDSHFQPHFRPYGLFYFGLSVKHLMFGFISEFICARKIFSRKKEDEKH